MIPRKPPRPPGSAPGGPRCSRRRSRSVACRKIAASGSLLIATIVFAAEQPTMCWVAPEIPAARYSAGRVILPVSPTWRDESIQPSSTSGRDAAAIPPRAAASSSTNPKFSCAPRPRPPATITSASSSRGPSARAGSVTLTRSVTPDRSTETAVSDGRVAAPGSATTELASSATTAGVPGATSYTTRVSPPYAAAVTSMWSPETSTSTPFITTPACRAGRDAGSNRSDLEALVEDEQLRVDRVAVLDERLDERVGVGGLERGVLDAVDGCRTAGAGRLCHPLRGRPDHEPAQLRAERLAHLPTQRRARRPSPPAARRPLRSRCTPPRARS